MTTDNTTPSTKLLSVVLPLSIYNQINALAVNEQRSKSKMAVILLTEALKDREDLVVKTQLLDG